MPDKPISGPRRGSTGTACTGFAAPSPTRRLRNHAQKIIGKPWAGKPHARIERGMGKRTRTADTAPLTTNEQGRPSTVSGWHIATRRRRERALCRYALRCRSRVAGPGHRVDARRRVHSNERMGTMTTKNTPVADYQQVTRPDLWGGLHLPGNVPPPILAEPAGTPITAEASTTAAPLYPGHTLILGDSFYYIFGRLLFAPFMSTLTAVYVLGGPNSGTLHIPMGVQSEVQRILRAERHARCRSCRPTSRTGR